MNKQSGATRSELLLNALVREARRRPLCTTFVHYNRGKTIGGALKSAPPVENTRWTRSLLLFFDRKCKDDEIQDAQNECDPIAGLDVFEHKPRNQKQADQDYSNNQLNNSSLAHIFSP